MYNIIYRVAYELLIRIDSTQNIYHVENTLSIVNVRRYG